MARIVPKPVKAPFWWAVKETEIRVLPRPKGYDAGAANQVACRRVGSWTDFSSVSPTGYIPITGNTAARILAFLAHPPFVNMLKGHGVLPQGFLGPHIPNCIARIDARTKTAAPFVNSTGPDKLPLTTLVKLRNFVLAFLVDISQDRSITVTRLPTNHAQYRSNPIGILIKKGNADRGGRKCSIFIVYSVN